MLNEHLSCWPLIFSEQNWVTGPKYLYLSREKKNDLNKDSVYGLKIYASLGQNKEVCVNARCILKVKIKIQFDKSEKLIFSSKDKMLKMSGWFHKYRRLRESTDGMNTADEWEEIMRTDLLHYMFLEEKWGRKF